MFVKMVCLFLLTSQFADGQTALSRVIDTNTQMPGETVTFNGLGSFVVDGDDTIFTGSRTFSGEPTYAGLYRIRNGVIEKLVDLNTVAPGPDPSFEFIQGVSVLDGKYLFGAQTTLSDNGLFLIGDAEPLLLFASSSDARRYANVSYNDDESVTFAGSLTELLNNDGIFHFDQGVMTPIATTSTPIPGGTGTFEGLTFRLNVDNVNGSSVFVGDGSGSQQGIYTTRNGTLEKLYDLTDVMPGSSDNFVGFVFPQHADNGDIAFLTGTATNFGYFKSDAAGNFDMIVDLTTPFPGSASNFASFGLAEYNEGKLLFFGNDTGNADPLSLIYHDGSDFELLLTPGDVIDGETITFIGTPSPIKEGVFHTNLRFDNDTIAVYRVELESPGPVTVLAENFSVSNGLLRGGDLNSMSESDNERLRISRSNQSVSPVVELVVKGVSSNDSPSALSITLESSVFARGTITQRIELYNYDTESFEVIDTRDASRFSDAVHVVGATGDVARFVELGTGCIEARLRYNAAIGRARFTASIDQVKWDLE